LDRNYLNAARGWFHTVKLSPEKHVTEEQKIRGTIQFIRQVGGRGANRVCNLGDEALDRLREISLRETHTTWDELFSDLTDDDKPSELPADDTY
jgi:hypothetical protein